MSLFQTPPEPELRPGRIGHSHKTRSVVKLFGAQSALVDMFPALDPDTVYHYASAGLWSMHDLVFRCLEIIGPAHVCLATWSVSRDAACGLISACGDGRILTLSCLFDWRVRVRCPEAVHIAKLNGAKVRVCVNHSKVTCIQNHTHTITVVSSANLTSNPRIEAGVVCTDLASYNFHKSWIMDEIAGLWMKSKENNHSGLTSAKGARPAMTAEQKRQIEELAELQFTPAEVAIVVGVREADIRAEADGAQSYMRGRLRAQAEVRRAMFALAKQGSTPAQTTFLGLVAKSQKEAPQPRSENVLETDLDTMIQALEG